ncbi:hypothetical protein CEXT_536891 [Caerostris extrusa]|uniref:Uncharacterized protein n=1 Tax=Caerostris extrusa TaxID=172846 RepID=A0AAV4RZR1_CAEEX|nr:hypothetical protein CEXT_536891 [Caerostris extrusa]
MGHHYAHAHTSPFLTRRKIIKPPYLIRGTPASLRHLIPRAPKSAANTQKQNTPGAQETRDTHTYHQKKIKRVQKEKKKRLHPLLRGGPEPANQNSPPRHPLSILSQRIKPTPTSPYLISRSRDLEPSSCKKDGVADYDGRNG